MDLYLNKMFADTERIKQAIEKGVSKRMRWALLSELCDPQKRAEWMLAIHRGEYEIEEPYVVGIPKPHSTELRYVTVLSNLDRVFMSMANDITFEECGKQLVHPCCMSYQKGIGCGTAVKRCVREIKRMTQSGQHRIGVKLDLSKYFDSVPRWKIHEVIDKVEGITGKSAVLEVIRKFYDDDRLLDKASGEHLVKFQSLKQGVAFASFLADACLYHIDKAISVMDVFYVRYSDDMIIVGKDWKRAMQLLEKELGKLGMKLNPKKIEMLDDRKWFRFLGFNIRGEELTISADSLKWFKTQVQDATIKRVKEIGKGLKEDEVVRRVTKALYGDQNHQYSWASYVLPVINNKHDIMAMNAYLIDCIRAAVNGYTRVSGLGCDWQGKEGCVKREDDRWKSINRRNLRTIGNFNTIDNMRMLICQDRAAFRCELRELYRPTPTLPVREGE